MLMELVDNLVCASSIHNLDQAVREMRQGTVPTSLDESFLARAVVGQSSQAGVLCTFQGFGFTDDSRAFTERGKKLRDEGPGTSEAALKALQETYPYLWPRAREESFGSGDLDSYIIRGMTQGAQARSLARNTFLWLVSLSGNDEIAERYGSQSRHRGSSRPLHDRGGESSSSRGSSAATPGSGDSSNPGPVGPLAALQSLSGVLSIHIDSNALPELVREIRELLVGLLRDIETGTGNESS